MRPTEKSRQSQNHTELKRGLPEAQALCSCTRHTLRKPAKRRQRWGGKGTIQVWTRGESDTFKDLKEAY